MRIHVYPSLPLALAAALLAGACATSAPAPEAGDSSARAAAGASGASAVTPDAGTRAEADVSGADVDGAIWGVASATGTEELRAFLAESPAAGTDGTTRAVSFSDGEDAPAGHVVTALRLRSGKMLAGRLVSDDGSSVEFEFETPDGVRGTTRVAYADIHPESVAELMLARADQGDAAALMDIAEYAAGERLFEIARVHYLAAAEKDPAVAEIAERRLLDMAVTVSSEELDRGRSAVADGNDAMARRILRRVQREFAGTEAADEAAAAVAEIDARAEAKRLDDAREKQLDPIRSLLAAADKLTGEGLSRADRPANAVRSYMAARSKAASARRRLPAAVRAADKNDDSELRDALADLEDRIDEQEIDNETHLATAYLEKGDFNRARQAANAVLALDGQNREALSLLGRIRAAEEERRADAYDVWWYRYRRHHRVYPYPHRWYPRRGRSWGTIRRSGGASTRAPIGVFRR